MDGLEWKTRSKWMIWGYTSIFENIHIFHYFIIFPYKTNFRLVSTEVAKQKLKAFQLTPPKTNMEPEKGLCEKEKPFTNNPC